MSRDEVEDQVIDEACFFASVSALIVKQQVVQLCRRDRVNAPFAAEIDDPKSIFPALEFDLIRVHIWS